MTDTAKLIKRLENKAKAGWKCYFIERDKVYYLQDGSFLRFYDI